MKNLFIAFTLAVLSSLSLVSCGDESCEKECKTECEGMSKEECKKKCAKTDKSECKKGATVTPDSTVEAKHEEVDVEESHEEHEHEHTDGD